MIKILDYVDRFVEKYLSTDDTEKRNFIMWSIFVLDAIVSIFVLYICVKMCPILLVLIVVLDFLTLATLAMYIVIYDILD